MTQNATNTPAVSILVPVYNVEQFLPQCLDAILAQTLQDIEIIALDDGSTDGSSAILAKYAQQDSRLRVITKPNEGYGKTINRGIAEARGQYVGVIESDDWPEPDMYEKLYAAAKQHDADLVQANFFSTYEDHEEPYYNLDRDLPYGQPINMFDYPQVVQITPTLWGAIYRRDFLNECNVRCRETPGASYQDVYYTLTALIQAPTCVLLRDPLIHYRRDSEGSSSNTGGKVYAVCEEFADVRRFLAKNPRLHARFSPYLYADQFSAYDWNYRRIAPQERVGFITRIRGEFQAGADAGEIVEALFGPPEYETLLEMLVMEPEQFVEKYPDAFAWLPQPPERVSLVRRIARAIKRRLVK